MPPQARKQGASGQPDRIFRVKEWLDRSWRRKPCELQVPNPRLSRFGTDLCVSYRTGDSLRRRRLGSTLSAVQSQRRRCSMKWNMVLSALVVSVGLCGQSFGFELLERMLGLNDCGCNTCCTKTAPSCGCDKGTGPSSCEAAAAPSCGCAAPAAPSCGCAAPAAAAPSCGCAAPAAAAPSCGCAAPAAAAPSCGCAAPAAAAPSCGCAAPAAAAAPSCGCAAPAAAAPSCGCAAAAPSEPSCGSAGTGCGSHSGCGGCGIAINAAIRCSRTWPTGPTAPSPATSLW